MSAEKESFLGELLAKLAYVKQAGGKTGIDTSALVNEVERQIKQVSRASGGNPITGKGATKSGEED